MWVFIKEKFWYLYGTFHGSESILWNRLNILLGSVWVSLQGVDISVMHVFHDHPEYLVYWIIFSNFVNETARRHRAEFTPDGSIK